MTKTIDFNIQKKDRKKLVEAISEFVCLDPEYCGAPSFAYKIGAMTVDKNGLLKVPFIEDEELEIIGILEFLTKKGFTAASITTDIDEEGEEIVNISLQIPMADITPTALDNLFKLIESKEDLIKKALGCGSLPVNLTDDGNLEFPWFSTENTPEEINAYTVFITKLIETAKKQSRVTSKQKTVENEKFAFRCFLLKLGFIGEEYKQERKILLKNLSGSSAFKNGGGADVSE